jgi:hypothetical protein
MGCDRMEGIDGRGADDIFQVRNPASLAETGSMHASSHSRSIYSYIVNSISTLIVHHSRPLEERNWFVIVCDFLTAQVLEPTFL